MATGGGKVRQRLVGIGALLAVVALPACHDGSSAPAADRVTTTTAPIWASTLPAAVSLGAPTTLLGPAPNLPAGTLLASLGLPKAVKPRPALGRSDAAQTLWADPTKADVAGGRQLVVGRGIESDTGGPLTDEGAKVTVQGQDGRISHIGPAWLVTWNLPDAGTDCACSQQAAVAGRGLTRAQVLAIAAVAHPEAVRPSVPATALPKGLRSLGTAPTLGIPQPYVDGHEAVHLAVGRTRVDLLVWGGDPRLAAHLGFWAAAHRGLGFASKSYVSVTAVHGQVVTADTAGPDGDPIVPAALDRVITSLGPISRAAATIALTAALHRPAGPDDICDPSLADQASDQAATIVLRPEKARIVVGLLKTTGNGFSECTRIDSGDRQGGGQMGLSATPAVANATTVRVFGAGTDGLGNGLDYTIVSGDVPAGAVRVTVRPVGKAAFDGVVGSSGPAPGRLWFAAAQLGGNVQGVNVPVVAYDADGNEVGRTTAR